MKKTALYGAVLGDIIGVPYEFDRNKPTSKDSFPLFRRESNFSDDTVTTIAVADAILKSGDEEDGRIFFNTLVKTLQTWCRKYPHRGYGGRFRDWIVEKNPEPYNSYGNGSAMRVSAAGWFCDNIYDTRECARTTARITRNHKEGVKGAMATACAIFLARTGNSKEAIKSYIEFEFGYDLNRKIDDIRVHYRHTEKIWETVPEAVIAFLESTDFESAIRNTVWLGGDVDTVGAITGSIAEAFYGVPDDLIAECRKRLPKEMLDVIDRFNGKVFAQKKTSVPTEFTHHSLSDNLLTKKFFEGVMFIHTSASGAMGDAGILEVWNKRFEHYKCYWTSKTAEKLSKAFLSDEDTPDFKNPKKSGWCFYYMGCGHNFYIREEFAEAYLNRFKGEGYGGEIYPAEEIMLKVLR